MTDAVLEVFSRLLRKIDKDGLNESPLGIAEELK